MRNAFAVLGLGFAAIFLAGYFLIEKAEAPTATVATKDIVTLTLTSPAFTSGGNIPSVYTCDGENINPPLTISGAPKGTQSFVLIVTDPDIPQTVKDTMHIDVLDHWILFNIPSTTADIKANTPDIGTRAMGTKGDTYLGPCPPREYEPQAHRYVFTLHALSTPPNLVFTKQPTKNEVEKAVKSSILETSILIGRYERAPETLPKK